MIEARADAVGAPLLVAKARTGRSGRSTAAWPSSTRHGLLDLPLPRLIGAHQVGERRHRARRAARARRWTRPPAPPPSPAPNGRRGCSACAAARWSRPPAPAELWLDGGHNPAAGAALAEALTRLPPRPLHLVTGMLRTKDVAGFLRPLAALARSLHGVTIPGEAATLTAEETVAAARAAGLAGRAGRRASPPPSPRSPPRDPGCRILICGSLYLAGRVLRENG